MNLQKWMDVQVSGTSAAEVTDSVCCFNSDKYTLPNGIVINPETTYGEVVKNSSKSRLGEYNKTSEFKTELGIFSFDYSEYTGEEMTIIVGLSLDNQELFWESEKF